jgi:polyisoprenoid-binding protein YceI
MAVAEAMGLLTIPTGTRKADPLNSSVEFSVRSMGIVNVRGHFNRFEGSLTVDEEGILHAETAIEAASVDTRLAKRDEHLRSPDFFDVESHPPISFRTAGPTRGAASGSGSLSTAWSTAANST